MGFVEDRDDQPFNDISPEQTAYLRAMLDTHANDPTTGNCPVCNVRSCPDWRYAHDELAAAGLPMAEPGRWQPANDRDKRR
jgi:hypothetical protein